MGRVILWLAVGGSLVVVLSLSLEAFRAGESIQVPSPEFTPGASRTPGLGPVPDWPKARPHFRYR